MIVLLDTNIAIDYLLQRNQYEYINRIIDMAIQYQELECITATTITDIHYVVRKNSLSDEGERLTSYQVQDMLSDFFQYVEIIDVTADDIRNAIDLRWKDFEDAVQYSVAVSNGIDCIITNNVRDFENSEIDVFTPAEFLSYFKLREGSDDSNKEKQ